MLLKRNIEHCKELKFGQYRSHRIKNRSSATNLGQKSDDVAQGLLRKDVVTPLIRTVPNGHLTYESFIQIDSKTSAAGFGAVYESATFQAQWWSIAVFATSVLLSERY